MDFLWVVVAVIAAASVVAVLAMGFWRRDAGEQRGEMVEASPAVVSTEPEDDLETSDSRADELVIPIFPLSAATAIEPSELTEILDPTVIARISQAVPAIAETATRTAANAALKNMEVYKAILPVGKTLAESKTMEGAYRGFARAGTAANSRFSAQANFVKVDVSKTTAVATSVANVMNVGSLVVGQYYMSVINDRLETLNKSVERIGDFQDREFKSRIMSLIAHVGEISQFSAEIMEDDSQCTIKRHSLETLRREATQLLGQVNITMADLVQKNPTPKYDNYEELVREFTMLRGYQSALLTVLNEISELTYLLGRGSVSTGISHFLLDQYLEQSERAVASLAGWQANQVQRLHVDLGRGRRSKAGLDAVITFVPGMFEEKWKYRVLERELVAEIGTQSCPEPVCKREPLQVYDEVVEIIIKDGKLFYLH